jgi:pimeloyl-ACP methyl ester carboxylesterase
VLGHSWGGHLLLHLLAARPARVGAALVVDTLGAVGDGGLAAFEAEMERRTPPEVRERARELDERAMAGDGTERDALESLFLVWPAYFADPERSGPPPADLRLSVEAYAATFASTRDLMPGLAELLRGCAVPTRFVHGAASPMPVTASADTAKLLGAPVDVVPDTGHFTWLEALGAVRRNLDALP